MKIIKKDTPIYNRRIILIDEEKNNPKFNWNKLLVDTLISPFVTATKYVKDKEAYLQNSTAFGEIDYCYKNFKFPPQHPQKGLVYSCPDYESEFYIPLASFHQHSLKLKESAFIEMCGHLGAKEIILTEEIVDNTKIHLDGKADDIPTQNGKVSVGAKGSSVINKVTGGKVCFKFPKPSNQKFSPYESNWIETEPTWRTLQKERLENRVTEYSAELTYLDEMGITIDLAGKLNGLGLNIGGSFNSIKKTERKYQVIFWEDLE